VLHFRISAFLQSAYWRKYFRRISANEYALNKAHGIVPNALSKYHQYGQGHLIKPGQQLFAAKLRKECRFLSKAILASMAL
jgi:hypothetical protein